jgi:hypothetical protein
MIHAEKFLVELLVVYRPWFKHLPDCLPSHVDAVLLLAGEVTLA